MEHLSSADVARFWANVNIGLQEHCWNYKGHLNHDGYGKFSIFIDGKQKFLFAHRLAFRCINGPIPPGHVIRHMCHNPACCNPSHLAEGTHLENMRDMWTAGRGNPLRGERAAKAVLTEADVVEIVRLRRTGELGQKATALRFGVHESTIKRIMDGSNWQHVTEALGIVPTRKRVYEAA